MSLTDAELIELVNAGWTPPPASWNEPEDAAEGEVVFVWFVEDNEPFEHGVTDFAFKWEGSWLDLRDHDIESGGHVVKFFRLPEMRTASCES